MTSQARAHDAAAAAPTCFGTLLRRYRLRAGLSQHELAERAGLSVEGVGALERGTRRRPYPHTVQALAAALSLGDDERASLAAAIPPASTGYVARQPAATMPFSDARGGLPTPPTLIVGREREEAAIVRLLERSDVRLVTLTGPGGVGKTRLAIQVAISLGDRLGEVCFVDLSVVRDPGLVPSAMAHALGLRERGGLGPLENLTAALAAQPRLLLLDNFEHVVEAAPVVSELLSRCPQLTLLVTSRAPCVSASSTSSRSDRSRSPRPLTGRRQQTCSGIRPFASLSSERRRSSRTLS